MEVESLFLARCPGRGRATNCRQVHIAGCDRFNPKHTQCANLHTKGCNCLWAVGESRVSTPCASFNYVVKRMCIGSAVHPLFSPATSKQLMFEIFLASANRKFAGHTSTFTWNCCISSSALPSNVFLFTLAPPFISFLWCSLVLPVGTWPFRVFRADQVSSGPLC